MTVLFFFSTMAPDRKNNCIIFACRIEEDDESVIIGQTTTIMAFFDILSIQL